MSELNKIAQKILSKGKGILAADESNGTMTKRLESVNIQSTSENRLLFRETLFLSESMMDCIGGVILYDETINQSSNSGKKIPTLISDSGAIPGIKVDTGAKVLANSSEEKRVSLKRSLFSGVDWIFTESNLLVIVPLLSSAASIPLPFERIFRVILLSSDILV